MKKLMMAVAIIVGSFVLAIQPAAAAAGFSDVPASNRFHDEIQYLVGQEIITGYEDGTFQPKRNVTRGEVAIMVGRAFDLDGTKRETKFKDVNKSNGASGYIASATEKGILGGYPDGTFRPAQQISRGDMALILSRVFGLEFGSIRFFGDVGENMKAADAIYNIAGEYITTGYPDNTFRPHGKVTREQFSAFLSRGMSPEFKQRAVGSEGFGQNMTKRYVYATPTGDVEQVFQKGLKGFNVPKYAGFAWMSTNLKTKEVVYFLQEETAEELVTVFPFSDSGVVDLVYPIEVGSGWYMDEEEELVDVITSVTATVKTPYKTFTNAVEVTSDTGYTSYYVKGVGHVKTIDENGESVSELKSVE
ncbi:S-layer homology domain-containing protein [Sporosarcina aquimarina]|uniref:S-layer homology domain-containing protein n=1 Tax=Sporosarcina aquimarina TaxID=114975 RepID=A0ABU4FVX0_9BACL|nr:S-layer homology domain-containing protein [Sporosarcina aquimarina]MDW0108855.1 S-layer homology domain-containing protein [Sporosarcina aquimarina]